MSIPHALRVEGSRFWVTHRHQTYGPFDYEWSPDFCGVELTYQGKKYGEYCSADEIFAYLREFELPLRVVEVSSVASGCILLGIMSGFSTAERRQLLCEKLQEFGLAQFVPLFVGQ